MVGKEDSDGGWNHREEWGDEITIKSKLEDSMASQLKAANITGYQREYRFHPVRKWRFDFAFPDQRLAIEIDGGGWVGGRHSRGYGIESDCDKYNSAVLLGWRILRFTGKHVRNGLAIEIIEKVVR